MSDDNPQPPFVYEGLDPAPEPKSHCRGSLRSGERHRASGSVARSKPVGNPACH